MTFDASLADRLRNALEGTAGLSEKQAFGGLSFLLRGNMAVGVIDDELVVRVGPQAFDEAVAEPHARPFDFSGRPMKGWVYVGAEGCRTQKAVAEWAQRGLDFAAGLPPK
jgi:TfoX/Sxy family transcriptional regulator of competence genes